MAKPRLKAPMGTKKTVFTSKVLSMVQLPIYGKLVIEKISITTKETKPEGQYSKVSQVQFEKVQRKMANGMVQLLLQVLMAKLKMNDGIWDKKYEIKRLILSMNVNFYYLIIANWYFFSWHLKSYVGHFCF